MNREAKNAYFDRSSGLWRARFAIGGKTYNCGAWPTFDEAAKASADARRKIESQACVPGEPLYQSRLMRKRAAQAKSSHAGAVLLSPEDEDLRFLRCWHPGHKGHLRAQLGGRTVMMHRLVLERVLSRSLGCGEVCDHINGNVLDNRRENLRAVTQHANTQNRHGPFARGLRGVRKRGDRFFVVADVLGVRFYGGTYDTPEDAGVAAERLRCRLGFATSRPMGARTGEGSGNGGGGA